MTEKEAYQATKERIESLLSKEGFLPDIKGFKKIIAQYSKRINLLYKGSQVFAQTTKDVEKISERIAVLRGTRTAYKEALLAIEENIKRRTL